MFEEMRRAVYRVLNHITAESAEMKLMVQEVMAEVVNMQEGLNKRMAMLKSYLLMLRFHVLTLYLICFGTILWLIVD